MVEFLPDKTGENIDFLGDGEWPSEVPMSRGDIKLLDALISGKFLWVDYPFGFKCGKYNPAVVGIYVR